MAHLFGLELSWEFLQTVGAYLLGRSKNKPNPPAAGAAEGGRTEEPLKQQVTSLVKPRNDEAIQFAVDAALRKLRGGEQHVSNIQAVRMALEPHQQTDWRKNLGTHELTERFEHVMASETITRGGRGNQQAGAQLAQGGQERIERRFERRPRDYELTADDPRVQHLVLVSQIVSAEATHEQGVAKAKAYLLSAGLIKAKSAAQQAAEAAEKANKEITAALYRSVAGDRIRDRLRRYDDDIELATADNDDDLRRQLERERQQFIVEQSRIANVETKKGSRKLTWIWIGIAGIFFIVVMMA